MDTPTSLKHGIQKAVSPLNDEPFLAQGFVCSTRYPFRSETQKGGCLNDELFPDQGLVFFSRLLIHS